MGFRRLVHLLVLVLVWASGGGALAAVDVMLVSPQGLVRAGDTVDLQLVLFDGASPAGVTPRGIDVDKGSLIGAPLEQSGGVWSFRWQAPSAPGEVRFTVVHEGGDRELALPVAPPLESTLSATIAEYGLAGQSTPMTIRVARKDGGSVRPGRLVVVVPEGTVTRVDAAGRDAVVSWVPGPDPFPRSVPIAIHEEAGPDEPPTWVVASLRARPKVPVRTEPGTRVTLRVGRRTYGPYVAGADGVATATPEVRPGEEIAEVVLEDRVGNTQKSTLTLGGDPRPGLVVLANGSYGPGEAPPDVWARAVQADGAPWGGAAPQCSTSLGEAIGLTPIAAGVWRLGVPPLPDDAFFDLRVDCHLLHQARASVRVPVMSAQPTRLEIRAWPPELDAANPLAHVQAYLENRLGDRLPATGIEIGAELGELRIDPAQGDLAAVRAEYVGTAAVAAGGDHLVAEWNRPPGEGDPWRIDAEASWTVGTTSMMAWGRALDRAGRPLEGVELAFTAGAGEVVARTDGRGWARASVPVDRADAPAVLAVRAGVRGRDLAMFPGCSPSVQPAEADLVARLDLPIRSGRVRGVFLSTEPRTLVTGDAQTAKVTVRLVGREGTPVTDEPVELEASEGEISRLRQRSDGTFEATFTPPPRAAFRTVRITASSKSGAFAQTTTEIAVVPREIRRAPGVRVGYLVGRHDLASPYLGLAVDERLPWGGGRFYGRLSIGFYGEQAVLDDPMAGEDVSLEMSLLPVGLGMLARQERHRLGVWVGTSVLAVPYRLEARYGEAVPASGLGFGTPGIEPFAGLGWRLANSEAGLEFSYVFITMDADDVGWSGPVGGAMAALAFRLFL